MWPYWQHPVFCGCILYGLQGLGKTISDFKQYYTILHISSNLGTDRIPKDLFGDSVDYDGFIVSKKEVWQALYLNCEILIASITIIQYNISCVMFFIFTMCITERIVEKC